MRVHRNGDGLAGREHEQALGYELHQQMVQDLGRLHDTRTLLVERLEHIVVALTLTLDAESAAAERLAGLQEAAGARPIDSRPTEEWCRIAQRYRAVIHALESINDDYSLQQGGRER
jgi:hypothetical protein